MLSLSTINRFISRMRPLNAILDKLTNKIIPSTSAAASCPDGFEYYLDTFLRWECWASTTCDPDHSKCVKVVKRTYYYLQGTCSEEWKICNYTGCVGTAECVGSG